VPAYRRTRYTTPVGVGPCRVRATRKRRSSRSFTTTLPLLCRLHSDRRRARAASSRPCPPADADTSQGPGLGEHAGRQGRRGAEALCPPRPPQSPGVKAVEEQGPSVRLVRRKARAQRARRASRPPSAVVRLGAHARLVRSVVQPDIPRTWTCAACGLSIAHDMPHISGGLCGMYAVCLPR
jgi:hypothetical protein